MRAALPLLASAVAALATPVAASLFASSATATSATTSTTAATTAAAGARGCLPLAPPGTLLGAAFGGAADNATNALFLRTLAAGARLAQVSITWAALERTPGVVDAGALVQSLLGVRRLGLTPIVNIAVIDTNNVGVPADLADASDPTALAPGLTWTSPALVQRYALALQTLAPLAAYYGAPYIGIGNEVDVNLGAHPVTAYAFVELVDIMAVWVRNLTSPDMAVGATLTVGGINAWAGQPPAWFGALTQVADVTPLTYYPLAGDFHVLPPAVVAGALAAAVAVLPPAWCVLLQEVGYPAGYNNASSTDGSSYALQAGFVDAAFDAFAVLNGTAAGGRLRGASFCFFADVPPAECAALARYYNVSAPAFVEYLCTLGLVADGGAPKPAFDTFLARLAQAAG